MAPLFDVSNNYVTIKDSLWYGRALHIFFPHCSADGLTQVDLGGAKIRTRDLYGVIFSYWKIGQRCFSKMDTDKKGLMSKK